MPPIRVRNKATGKIDIIQWDRPEPPTPDDIRTIMSGGALIKPEQYRYPGMDTDPEVSAPMTSPNHGESSWYNNLMSPVDIAEGLRSSAARTIYGGGDLIRRALGMERIHQLPEVQEAMTAPNTWGGTLGSVGGDVAQFAIPGANVTKAAKGLSLGGRLATEGLMGAGVAGLQSAGDPYKMAVGAGIGVVAPPIAGAIGRAASPYVNRLFGRPSAGMTDEMAADMLLGRQGPRTAYEAESAMLGQGASAADEAGAASMFGRPPVPTPPRPMAAWEAEDTLLGQRPIRDTPLQSPWAPPTRTAARQLPSAAASSGSRFLGSQGRAPIDVTSPIPSSAEAEVFAGSGQTAAARRAGGRPKPIRGPAGRFRARTDEEALYLPREEGAAPFADLPPQEQAPYLNWLGRDEVIPPPPLSTEAAGLSDADYMSLLRQRSATGPQIVRNPSTTRTARTDVPTREYVGRPAYTPKVPSPGATPRESALADLENSVLERQASEGVSPSVPSVPAPKEASPTVRRLENQFGRELTDEELAVLGETRVRHPFANERGAVNPELARHLGGGIFGGAYGGLHGDTTEERVKNAALGAALGFGASVAPTLGRAGGSRGSFKTGPITHPRPSLFSKMGRGRLKAEAIDALNAPRAIMASVDLSAPLRQGATMIHRPEYWKALPSMVKAFGSEDSFQALQKEIQTRPSFEAMKEARLALSDLAKGKGDDALREELFMSRIAERIPGLGRAIRASGRGYVGFLNKLRADSFDSLAAAAPKGTDMKQLANYINNATGRGSLGKFESSAPLLNAALFSPRLMASRVQMMNPKNYMSGDPFVRKQYLKSMLAFGGAVGTVLKLAEMNGADVETDPRSSDFAKIKIGDTRLDIGAGFQQYIRTAAQVATGERKDLQSGRIKTLGKKYKDPTRKDVIANFIEAKASPILGFMIDMAEGKDFTGEKVQLLPEKFPPERKDYMKSQLGRRLSPMIIQDFYDLYDEDPSLLGLMAPAAFGASIQVHRPRIARHAQ